MSTYTFSGTDTYSVADVEVVMQNTYEDIIGFANRQIISFDTAEKWIDDLTYVLNKKVVKFFELQLKNEQGVNFKGFRYKVDSYGYLSTGSDSGGINYYEFPANSKVILFLDLDNSNSIAKEIYDELKKRGWGVGTAMEGNESHDRNYVSNSLRIQRSEITK